VWWGGQAGRRGRWGGGGGGLAGWRAGGRVGGRGRARLLGIGGHRHLLWPGAFARARFPPLPLRSHAHVLDVRDLIVVPDDRAALAEVGRTVEEEVLVDGRREQRVAAAHQLGQPGHRALAPVGEDKA
jgi:hypothetical protein